mmetsp:Transcript_2658/g.5527  ORF Transcript_2658/g.5527 Transcript_2658/m.5527 type:complete len:331 (+) Transcript_2658:904-1896(+)
MICSSLSLSLCVSAIMMSLCLRRSCLYRSTWAFSSSIVSRSLSISAMRPSYSFLMASWYSVVSWWLSPSSPLSFPFSPLIIWSVSIAIRSSNFLFSSFSFMNSRLLASRALMAAILSASALLLCSSISRSLLLSTTFLFFSSSSARSLLSSLSYFLRRDFWSRSSFTLGSFLMFLALLANLRVLKLSTIASRAGLIIAIMVVLQFPPRLSSRILVSFESRYGTCVLPLVSVRAEMTFPSADRLWLIFLDSSSLWPVAPERRTRSEPARSTRFSLPTLKDCFTRCIFFWSSSTSVLDCSTIMMKTAWERDDISFILVLPVARTAPPLSMRP